MYIICPLAGVRQLHFIFILGYPCHLGGKKRKGEMCPPLFPLSKRAPLLFPNSILSVPPGQQHSKTHTRISFSSVHKPSPPTSLQEERKKRYITLKQMVLTLNNKNKEIKRLCNLWQVIKALFSHSFSLCKMHLSYTTHTHTHTVATACSLCASCMRYCKFEILSTKQHECRRQQKQVFFLN